MEPMTLTLTDVAREVACGLREALPQPEDMTPTTYLQRVDAWWHSVHATKRALQRLDPHMDDAEFLRIAGTA